MMHTPGFFRSRIDTMINLNDPLAVLATRMPWAQIEASLMPKFEHAERPGNVLESADLFGTTMAVVGAGRSEAGRPKLPLRLMSGLVYLKHAYNVSDEELAARWSENVLWQFFGGMDCYEHRQPCDPTQIGRFRRAIGEDGMELLLKATIDTAVETKAAKRAGIGLKQTFAKEGKELRRRAGGYAHAKQFKRLRKVVKRQRTIPGIVMREAGRKIEAPGFVPQHPKAPGDLLVLLERPLPMATP